MGKWLVQEDDWIKCGHGQNFVQKGWDNGKFSHGPDEERIGSIIFLKGGLKSHSIYYLF